MRIEEMLDIFDIDEIENMSPEECKGLLKGFFIGAGFISMAIENRYTKKRRKADITRSYNSYTSLYSNHSDFKNIRLEFEEKMEAQDILDDLRERLQLKDVKCVTVRDLFSRADLPTTSDMKNWGW